MGGLNIETEGGYDIPEDEWVGMPEFLQRDKKPFATIKVRIKTEADFIEFKKLVDQHYISPETSIWFPKLEKGLEIVDKRYVDENDIADEADE